VISAAENSNKFPKIVEDLVTLGPTAQATLVFMKEQVFLKMAIF